MKTKISDFSEKELLEKILSILTGKNDSPVSAKQLCTRQLYSNKELMDLLQVKDRYLKKLRDNGYIGYSREGDKYWYTQDDVNKFLRKFHYEAFATNPNLPERIGGDVW
jgi:phage pi2 protein 07